MSTFQLAGVDVPRIGLGTNRLRSEHVGFHAMRRRQLLSQPPEILFAPRDQDQVAAALR